MRSSAYVRAVREFLYVCICRFHFKVCTTQKSLIQKVNYLIGFFSSLASFILSDLSNWI